MASRGTCTLLSETSAALAGLPCRGPWQGDREWNSGLPGAEPRLLWALVWDRAGEPGIAAWSRACEEGEPWPGMAPTGIPKLPPLVI